ncbi:MAG: HEAT repeat domain-containing protein [bacterium]|jgi:HEAT repeat protein|nr:HEAT repeat domain-containing protein [bacterium]
MIHSSLPINLATAAVSADEQKYIDILQSAEASRKDKADACRLLSRCATEASVEPLAALLDNEELAHMARYGLETIDSPKVNEVLRAALGKVKGRLLAGVIGSLGVRKDAGSVEAMIPLLKDADPIVAQAAARALGSIGTREAVQALMRAVDQVAPASHLAFCEGLFRAAERAAASDEKRVADRIYQKLLSQTGPHQVRTGAFRGLVLVRGNAAIPLILLALNGTDFGLVQAAALVIQELPGSAVIQSVAAELAAMPAEKQILLVQTFAERADLAALSAVMKVAEQGEKAARIAAIQALPAFQNKNVVPVLEKQAQDGDAEIAEAAKFALAAMS